MKQQITKIKKMIDNKQEMQEMNQYIVGLNGDNSQQNYSQQDHSRSTGHFVQQSVRTNDPNQIQERMRVDENTPFHNFAQYMINNKNEGGPTSEQKQSATVDTKNERNKQSEGGNDGGNAINQNLINQDPETIQEESNRNSYEDSQENQENQGSSEEERFNESHEQESKNVELLPMMITGSTKQRLMNQENEISQNVGKKQVINVAGNGRNLLIQTTDRQQNMRSTQVENNQLTSLQFEIVQQNNKTSGRNQMLRNAIINQNNDKSIQNIMEVNYNSIQNVQNNNHSQQYINTNSQSTSALNSPKKYFSSSALQGQSMEVLPRGQPQTTITGTKISTQHLQLTQNPVIHPLQPKLQGVLVNGKNSPKIKTIQTYINQQAVPISPPLSPQNSHIQIQQQQQQAVPLKKLESMKMFPKSQFPQNSPKMLHVSSLTNLHQRSNYQNPKIFSSTDSLFQVSGSPPPPEVMIQRKSVQGELLKRPSVYFRYLNNVQPGKNIGMGVQNPVQVIKEHVHSHTVVEKTVTVVWEYRYWTVIEKFNYMTQKFNEVANQLKIITQYLQVIKNKQKYDQLYGQLVAKHASLLQMYNISIYSLSQIQSNINSFVDQSIEFKKEIQYENEYKQYITYKDKYKILEDDNIKLVSQLQRYHHELQSAFTQINRLNQIRRVQVSQSYGMQVEMKIKVMEEELTKSQVLRNQLKKYIEEIQQENRGLQQELGRVKGKQGNTNGKQEQHQFNIQHYIDRINELQTKVEEMEQNEQSSQYSESKYAQIIETQRNIIENIESHFKQFTQSSTVREEELKNMLQKQQETIKKLENQPNRTNNVSGQSGIEREEIEGNKKAMKELKLEVEREREMGKKMKEQLGKLTEEITKLNQQKIQSQRVYETKLQQKLISIEQELKSKDSNNRNIQRFQIQTPNISNNQQITQLNEQIDRLSAQVKKKQQEKRKIEEEFITEQEGLKIKLMEQEGMIRELNDKISNVEEEHKKKLVEKEKSVRQLRQEIQTLNDRIKSYTQGRRSASQLGFSGGQSPTKNEQQLKNMRDKLFQKEQQCGDIQKQKENIQKKYQLLLGNFHGLDEESSKKDQELMSLKRQISGLSNYQSEISSLTEAVNKKNQEILELKTLSFERNQFKIELDALINQRNVTKTTIQGKNQEIETLRRSINEMESKLREKKLKQNLYPNTNQSVADELQLMYQSAKKKQAEVNKLKQTNQQLQTTVQKLEYDLERTKNKLGSAQKNLSLEKEEYANQTSGYEVRIKQFETKIRSIDQSQKQVKNGYEQEVQGLDTTIKQKQQQIRKLQGQNKVLKNKLKNYDIKIEEVDFDREALNNKIKELERMREDLKKKIETLEESQQNRKNKLNEQYQIKIVQMETAMKVKDNRIKQLENSIETLKIKEKHTNQSQDDFINQQQIQVLRRKIAQYESRSNQTSGKQIDKNYKLRDYESTTVFEQKVIYELKSQNEKLKIMLAGKGGKVVENVPIIKSGNAEFLQKRLLDFNKKLGEMIEENKNLEEKNGDFAIMSGQKLSQQLLISFQRQRRSILRKHRAQIAALQSRMIELQRYCSSLENVQANSAYGIATNARSANDSAKGVYSEQLNYYKEKNNELQDRIDSHIKLNKQLKEKLQGRSKNNGEDGNPLDFYRGQVEQYKKQNNAYQQRIRILTEQNSSLSKNIDELRKNKQVSERSLELENKINELNRKNSSLQMQNSILQMDANKYSKDLKNANEEIATVKMSGEKREQKMVTLENNLMESNSKLSVYEKQNVKYANQIKLLQSEIERLNNKNEEKLGESYSQKNRYKHKMLELQSKLRQNQQYESMWNQDKASYQETISIMSNKINGLQIEISRITFVNESINRKVREAENEIYQLEGKVKMERSRGDEFEDYAKKKDKEVADGVSMLEKMKKEMDNEANKNKQRIVYISQLEENIQNVKSELVRSKNQLERVQSKNNIDRTKYTQMSNVEQGSIELRKQIQKFHSEISDLKAQNDALREGMVDKEGLNYRLEYVRSYFTEIDAFVEEIQNNCLQDRQIQVIKEIKKSVDGGLSICSATFDLL